MNLKQKPKQEIKKKNKTFKEQFVNFEKNEVIDQDDGGSTENV